MRENWVWLYHVYIVSSEISIYKVLLFACILYLKFININCSAVMSGYSQDNPSNWILLVARPSLYRSLYLSPYGRWNSSTAQIHSGRCLCPHRACTTVTMNKQVQLSISLQWFNCHSLQDLRLLTPDHMN